MISWFSKFFSFLLTIVLTYWLFLTCMNLALQFEFLIQIEWFNNLIHLYFAVRTNLCNTVTSTSHCTYKCLKIQWLQLLIVRLRTNVCNTVTSTTRCTYKSLQYSDFNYSLYVQMSARQWLQLLTVCTNVCNTVTSTTRWTYKCLKIQWLQLLTVRTNIWKYIDFHQFQGIFRHIIGFPFLHSQVASSQRSAGDAVDTRVLPVSRWVCLSSYQSINLVYFITRT